MQKKKEAKSKKKKKKRILQQCACEEMQQFTQLILHFSGHHGDCVKQITIIKAIKSILLLSDKLNTLF